MPGWILDWRDNAEHLLEKREYLWLSDAERQVQACLTLRPDSHVSLLRRLMRSAGGTEVNLLVHSFPDSPGDPGWIASMPQQALFIPPGVPPVVDYDGGLAAFPGLSDFFPAPADCARVQGRVGICHPPLQRMVERAAGIASSTSKRTAGNLHVSVEVRDLDNGDGSVFTHNFSTSDPIASTARTCVPDAQQAQCTHAAGVLKCVDTLSETETST